MSGETPTIETGDDRVKKCRGCGADIIFLPTAAGRVMPCNADTVARGDEVYTHGKHVSHFSSCPQHEKFRRGGSHE